MAKYQVNGWVKLAGSYDDNEKAHILEVTEQTCEAGIKQVKYLIRLVKFGSYSSYPPGAFLITELEIDRKLTEEEIKKEEIKKTS